MEGAKAEATQACEQEVNAEDLWQVQCGFTGAGVLPDLKIPESPVPDGGQHQQA